MERGYFGLGEYLKGLATPSVAEDNISDSGFGSDDSEIDNGVSSGSSSNEPGEDLEENLNIDSAVGDSRFNHQSEYIQTNAMNEEYEIESCVDDGTTLSYNDAGSTRDHEQDIRSDRQSQLEGVQMDMDVVSNADRSGNRNENHSILNDSESISVRSDDNIESHHLLYLLQQLQAENIALQESERDAHLAFSRIQAELLVTEADVSRLRGERDALRRGGGDDLFQCNEKASLEELETEEERLRCALKNVVVQKERTMRDRLSEEEDKRTCVICQVEAKTVLLMPCRHLCVCEECAQRPQLVRCPLCREAVCERINVFS